MKKNSIENSSDNYHKHHDRLSHATRLRLIFTLLVGSTALASCGTHITYQTMEDLQDEALGQPTRTRIVAVATLSPDEDLRKQDEFHTQNLPTYLLCGGTAAVFGSLFLALLGAQAQGKGHSDKFRHM